MEDEKSASLERVDGDTAVPWATFPELFDLILVYIST
jgi:hypothetical protein